jgi:hypothetical protein
VTDYGSVKLLKRKRAIKLKRRLTHATIVAEPEISCLLSRVAGLTQIALASRDDLAAALVSIRPQSIAKITP